MYTYHQALFTLSCKRTERFEVLMAASMKFRIVLWVVLPCKIIVDRYIRGTCCLHHPGDDDGGRTCLWNVVRQLVYTAVHPRRQFWTIQHITTICPVIPNDGGSTYLWNVGRHYFTRQYIPEDKSEQFNILPLCAHSSLMVEAARTSETSVDNYFTRQYIPEDNGEHHMFQNTFVCLPRISITAPHRGCSLEARQTQGFPKRRSVRFKCSKSPPGGFHTGLTSQAISS
jgi:hypothetical protein